MSAPRPPDQEPGGPGELPAPAAGEPPGERLLRRSTSDKVLAGVCGGLGRYLGVEPVLLRIAAVVLALANGIGVIAYVIAWIVIPEERAGQPVGTVRAPRQETGRLVLGGALVVLGLVLLLDRIVPDLQRLFWPLAVVAPRRPSEVPPPPPSSPARCWCSSASAGCWTPTAWTCRGGRCCPPR